MSLIKVKKAWLGLNQSKWVQMSLDAPKGASSSTKWGVEAFLTTSNPVSFNIYY